MSDDFAPALPHGPITEPFPDVFVVRGSFDMAPLVRIGRNMIVLRRGGELTIVNSVRLTPEGEEALEALGEVKHVVRIGAFHGVDDPWYRHRYGATYWAQDGQRGPSPDELLSGGAHPFGEGASVFEFQDTRHPEAAVVLPAQELLLTCDAVQNIVKSEGASLMAKIAVPFLGLKRPSGVGKPWRKAMEDRNGPTLEADCERLLAEDWRHLISAHGPPGRDSAKQALRATLRKVYGGA